MHRNGGSLIMGRCSLPRMQDLHAWIQFSSPAVHCNGPRSSRSMLRLRMATWAGMSFTGQSNDWVLTRGNVLPFIFDVAVLLWFCLFFHFLPAMLMIWSSFKKMKSNPVSSFRDEFVATTVRP